MNRFLNFLLQYYDYILAVIFLVLSIISFILKYKSNNNNKKILRIFQVLPVIINEAEQIFKDVLKSGANKKLYVLERLQVLCNEVSVNYDENFWQQKIEDFLLTPQKNKLKGD